MKKVRKLTPELLKRIIKEEKSKITKQRHKNKNTEPSVERSIDMVTKIALQEAKHLLKIKKLREQRRKIKKLITSKVKK